MQSASTLQMIPYFQVAASVLSIAVPVASIPCWRRQRVSYFHRVAESAPDPIRHQVMSSALSLGSIALFCASYLLVVFYPPSLLPSLRFSFVSMIENWRLVACVFAPVITFAAMFLVESIKKHYEGAMIRQRCC